jgi:phosphocarrier protein HPr
MVHKTATIRNSMGIHVRPTGVIIDAFHELTMDVQVRAKGIDSDLKDHISILAMGLCKGDQVDVSVSGENEEAVCGRIVEYFEKEYDFLPRT